MTKLPILVVDDEPIWQTLLRRVLEVDDHTVIVVADAPAALAAMRASAPALVVLDDTLPAITGPELCVQLRRAADGRQPPIIMLTSRSEVASIVEALEAGADDCLVKPCDFDELRARVRAHLRRGQSAARRAVQHLTLDAPSRQAAVGERSVRLSPREFDLLSLLVRQEGRLVSREGIARDVWAGKCQATDNVIEVYVRRLRQKLAALNYRGRIEARWGRGYILEPLHDDQ